MVTLLLLWPIITIILFTKSITLLSVRVTSGDEGPNKVTKKLPHNYLELFLLPHDWVILYHIRIHMAILYLWVINSFITNGLVIVKQLEVMVTEGYLKQENKEMLLVGNNVSELMLKMYSYIAPEKSAVINKVINHDHKL